MIRVLAVLALLAPILLPGLLFAQTASVALTGTPVAGTRVDIDWSGPNGQGDWVGLAPVGSPGSAWSGAAYAYTTGGSPASIVLPSEAGAYELRYVTGASAVLASVPVTVAPLPAGGTGGASLSPLGALMGGEALSVSWQGPGASGDWIGLARPGTPGSDFVAGSYAYVSAGNPVSIQLPLGGGDYELRYVTADNAILVALPVSVRGGTLPEVALQPASAAPGAALSIPLGPEAPRAPTDYLYISRPGAPDGDYAGGWIAIPGAGPVAIAAPQEPGAWELRYVVTLGSEAQVIGRAPLAVTASGK